MESASNPFERWLRIGTLVAIAAFGFPLACGGKVLSEQHSPPAATGGVAGHTDGSGYTGPGCPPNTPCDGAGGNPFTDAAPYSDGSGFGGTDGAYYGDGSGCQPGWSCDGAYYGTDGAAPAADAGWDSSGGDATPATDAAWDSSSSDAAPAADAATE